MKNKKLIVLGGTISIILLTFCMIIIPFMKHSNENLEFGNQKSDIYKKIYTFKDGKKIYTNLSKINYISWNKREYSLEEALKKRKIDLDKILDGFEQTDALNDGGTRVYSVKKNARYINKNIKIFICKTVSGIKDIYITDEYDLEHICKKID